MSVEVVMMLHKAPTVIFGLLEIIEQKVPGGGPCASRATDKGSRNLCPLFAATFKL